MSFDLEPGAFSAFSTDLLADCQGQTPSDTAAVANIAPPVSAQPVTTYANIVLPGDFPDPTVTKIGDTYWASATSAEWGSIFPLFKSTNLVTWELVSHVFPDSMPEWAEASFWAPEISYENGKTYICYTARQKNGPLCVAIASADDPAGPYTDHGPLIGQCNGSIDGFPVRDEHGELYMVWKEDGNAYGEPTPIWAQRLNEERTALLGEQVELFRNDAKWEGNLVEGSAIVRHEGYFYMFYAGNGCCGSGCTYATGVARSRSLLGPWEKNEQNPILTKNKTWNCPGHGTVAEYNGRWFLLHHAYHASSHEFVGRQGILSEFIWNEQGWPEFEGNSPQAAPLQNVGVLNVTDNFTGNKLAGTWQWPICKQPVASVSDGQLLLNACPENLGAMVAQRTYAATYKTTATLDFGALPAHTFAGLAAVGDPQNALALMAGDGMLQLWSVKAGQTQCLIKVSVEECKSLGLRFEAWGGQRYRFSYCTNGVTWQAMPMNSFALNGTYLPPWDRGIRVGLLAQGPETATVAFNDFTIRNQR
ncbi:family 43 glycosylhydrolase [Hymenobacter sp. BT491]|uniref:family 43 glycosylhydrolase n=1 Tax=Hymenobacter sp. BT491 TaxID=2766779 RepID=UPI00292A3BF6|nr:family 43 glycosylhydrolase [Hymenobacter sp. BT491]